MGKKERDRKAAGNRARAFGGSGGKFTVQTPSPEDIDRIFMLQDTNPLTPEVMRHMINIGWAEKKLHECQEMGGVYCAPRDSILFPDQKGVEMVRDGTDFLIHHHELMFTRTQ